MRDDRSPVALTEAEGGAAEASSPVDPDRGSARAPSSDEGARHGAFRPGARIADKYVVERLIGEGGLGIVVAARHVHLDQVVAIKSLRPNALATKGVAERFLREARLAAKIRSEHVVRVYDVGTLPDGAPYMVMEYLAGTDLGRQLSANGPLSVERAVDYVLQACEALAEAHVAGIVHRDIKPDNLFIATSAGGKSILKILDFGISKMATRNTTSDNELTEAGDKFGTPVYMSPEQLLSARDVDARTDVWAMGVVLYELLTGKLPFDGDLPELCSAILTKPPVPLAAARPYLPEALQGVIDRCLEKKLEDRFQNVAELAQELQVLASPISRVRIDQVVQLILGTGESVRPSMPAPQVSGGARVRGAREELTLAETPERAATTGSGMASWGGAGAGDRRGARGRIVALAAASVVAAALALAAVAGSRAHSVPTSAPAAQAASPSAAPSPPALASPAGHLPASDPPAAPGSAPEPSASPAAPAASVPAARKTGRGASPAKIKPASPADPNAVINPFE